MITARWLALALLLTAATAGCTSGPRPAHRSASPSASTAPTPESSTVHRIRVPKRSGSANASNRLPMVPPLSAQARAAGLVDIRMVVPDAMVDLRYATSDNFVGVRLYPIGARCLVHESMAPGLKVAAARLRNQGYLLVFWDCYRPHAVQVHMFRIVPNPNWVARPGRFATSHESARSVDVTLAAAAAPSACPPARRLRNRCLLDMGTGFDDFTPRAYAYATNSVSGTERAHRALLRTAMYAGGITVYSGEWWHFDGPGADVPRPQLDAPLT